MKLNIKKILKKKSAKIAIVLVAIISTIATMGFIKQAQTETNALKETSPFYATEYYDSLFYVEGYGDLNVYVLRKDDGTESGPLGWCLNKNKIMPITEKIPYENFTGAMDKWEWELIDGKYPTKDQIANVQRTLFGYKFLFPNVMTDFGLEKTDNMSLYHAMQISTWSILENWKPEDVKIKDDVKNNPQLLTLAEKIHNLYTEMYKYGTNASNKTYTEGIKVVLDNTNTEVSKLTLNENSYVQGSTKGYYRTPLIEAIPKQSYGYYFDGEYAFTYKVELKNAPDGSRVVNENGTPQNTFSTKPGIGLEFYVEVPTDTIGNSTGNFEVLVTTTSFRRNAPMLWTPVSDTAYQAIIQDVTIPDADSKSFTINYSGSQKFGSIVVNKTGEQVSGYKEIDSEFGKIYQPTYSQKELSDTSFDLFFKYDDMIFTGTDGYEYFDGDKVQQNSMITDSSGKVVFNKVPMDADSNITKYTVVENSTKPGWLVNQTEKEVSIDKTKNTTGNVIFENQRVKVDFNFTKLQESANGNVPLEGAIFGVYASENIEGGIKKDSLVGVLMTDKNGKINGLSIDLPTNYRFYIKELKTSDNLVLNENVYYIDTTVSKTSTINNGVITVDIKDSSGNIVKEIVNVEKKASLSILKQEEKWDAGTQEYYYLSTKEPSQYEFKVYSDKEKTNLIATLNKDSYKNGKFTVDNLRLGTYYVVETKTNESYKLNNKVFKVELKYGKENIVNIQNEMKTTSLFVVKQEEVYDETTKTFTYKTLNNAKDYEFKVYSDEAKTKLITTLDKDDFSDGKFIAIDLKPIKYYIVETKANDKYQINQNTFDIELALNKENKVVIKNNYKAGSILIDKQEERFDVDADMFKYKSISDPTKYEFKVYSDEVKRTLVSTLDADDFVDGKFLLTGLKPMKYYIVETSSNSMFTLNENTFIVDLSKDLNSEIVIQNKVDTFEVKLYKKDDTNPNDVKVLKDVIFDLVYDGNVLYQSITDENGVATFKDVKRGITYEIVEHIPEGYIASEETLKIETDKVTRLWEATIYNKKITQLANISFTKVNSETNKPLEGATIGLYRKSDTGFKNPIKVDVTNEEGKILFSKLNINEEYIIREQIAPNGYFVAEDIEVSLKDLHHGDTKEITMKDDQYFGYIKLIKTDKTTKKPVSGAKYGLYDENMNLISEGITDDNGEYVFKDNQIGKYFVQEIEAPNGYRLDKTVYEATLFDIEKDGVEVKVEDESYDFTLKIIKVDNENRNLLLKGAGFALYHQSDTELVNPLFIGTTGEDGQVIFENLSLGKYIVVEEYAPEGYIISTPKVLLDLTDIEDKSIVTLTVYNEKQKEEIDIDPELPVNPEDPKDPDKPTIDNEITEDPVIPIKPEESESEAPIPTIKVENPTTGINNEAISILTVGGIVVVLSGIALSIFMFLKNKKNKE